MPTRSLKKVETLSAKEVSRKTKGEVKVRPQTEIRIQEAAKMITKGKGMNDVIDHMMEKHNLSYEQSRHYWVAACRFLVADMDETREALVKQNLQRLEKIINESMESRDYKMAKDTIAEMNKMLGLTGAGGLQVAVQNDPNTNTQQVFIKFD